MSLKTNSKSFAKSMLEKKLSYKKQKRINMKKLTIHSSREKDSTYYQNDNKFLFIKLISKNLRKYKTTKKQYDKLIINAIIFDQRNHKVAVFKNYLLWDETSEFLKRFYKIHESRDRIPKISEYYEKYTLFAPIYFGLDGLIIIIMNKWTKRKKNYLEYIEDHEDDSDSKNKNKDWNFNPILNASLLGISESKSKSITSKNTLELTKGEIEFTANNKNKQNDLFKSLTSSKEYTIPNNDSKKEIKNQNEKNKKSKQKETKTENENEKLNTKSFSEILEDLSSNYSAFLKIKEEKIYSKKNNIKNFTINNNKIKNCTSKKIINRCFILNTNNNNTSENTFSTNNNLSKKKNVTSINIPPSLKQKKISLTKKPKINKFSTTVHINNNFSKINNIIQRNKSNKNDIKKYEKLVMHTDNVLQKKSMVANSIPVNNTDRSKKTAAKLTTDSNFTKETNKFKDYTVETHDIEKLKKNSVNNIIEVFNKKLVYPNYFSGNVSGSIVDRNGKNKNLTNLKTKNTVCNINSLEVNKNYFSNLTHNNTNSDSYSNKSSKVNFTHNRKNNNFPLCYLYDLPKHEAYHNGILVTESFKKIIKNDDKGKYGTTDPLMHKILKISNNNNKKKQLCLTAANSLNKIKEGKKIITISNYNSNNSSVIKVNNQVTKKNVVMNRLSKKDTVFNKKKNINQAKNNGCLTSRDFSNSIKKQKHINLQIPKKIPDSKTFRQNQKKSSQKIDVNLNLNIHFDIDMEKSGNKKVIFNNPIINQQSQHIINTKYPKYSAIANMAKRINSNKLISTIRNNYSKNNNKVIKSNDPSKKKTNKIAKKEKERQYQ